MSVRTDVASQLREDWAELPTLSGVRVLATESALDDVQVPTALIRLQSVGRAPSAPLSHRTVHLLLTLISAHTDLDRAGDELEDLTDEVLTYLGPRYQHDDATVVSYGGDRLAADIPLTITATNTPPPSEE